MTRQRTTYICIEIDGKPHNILIDEFRTAVHSNPKTRVEVKSWGRKFTTKEIDDFLNRHHE